MRNNERGSAIVLVIFALTMLMILGASLSTSLVANYKMKKSETVSEQKVYVNDSCLSYTQAMLSNTVNTSLITSLQYAIDNTERDEEMTDDEYLSDVTSAAKNKFKQEMIDAMDDSEFPSDLEDNMNTIVAHYNEDSGQKILKKIVPVISPSSDFSDGKCKITYNIQLESSTSSFSASYTWDFEPVIENVCDKILGEDNATLDPTIIYIPIETIYG